MAWRQYKPHNHGLVVIGGYNQTGEIADTVEAFNFKKKSWSFLPPPPQRLYASSAVAMPDGRLLLIGGSDQDDRPTRRMWALTQHKDAAPKEPAPAFEWREMVTHICLLLLVSLLTLVDT